MSPKRTLRVYWCAPDAAGIFTHKHALFSAALKEARGRLGRRVEAHVTLREAGVYVGAESVVDGGYDREIACWRVTPGFHELMSG